jgi:uncharacterized membrane protein
MGVPVGEYGAYICIASSDPARPLTAVPASLEVQEAYFSPVLSAAVTQLSGQPGTDLLFNLVLENLGNLPDTFDLSVSGPGWPASLSTATASLGLAGSLDVDLTVQIPSNAPAGQTFLFEVTAASQSDPTRSNSLLLSVELPIQQLYLPIVRR